VCDQRHLVLTRRDAVHLPAALGIEEGHLRQRLALERAHAGRHHHREDADRRAGLRVARGSVDAPAVAQHQQQIDGRAGHLLRSSQRMILVRRPHVVELRVEAVDEEPTLGVARRAQRRSQL
jgi:hypothetical protein